MSAGLDVPPQGELWPATWRGRGHLNMCEMPLLYSFGVVYSVVFVSMKCQLSNILVWAVVYLHGDSKGSRIIVEDWR